MLRVGQIIADRYELLKRIGRGGMGTVYAARHTATGAIVALKVITNADLTDDTGVLARFQREVRLAGTIVSPHMVRVTDAGHDAESGLPFMAMELLEGEDLAHLLKTVAPLSVEVALRIAGQTLAGLACAHEAGVVHRDIKPANLFLARGEGGAIVVKILDFGIAKVRMTQLHDPAAGLTRTGSVLGSPHYMSPEQTLGVKSVDHRADLWSVGVVLYKCLSGHTPLESAESVGEIMLAVTSRPARPIQDTAPWVPPEVAAIVHRALSIDPELRYRTAVEMLEAVKAVAGELALEEPDLVPIPESLRARVAPRLAEAAQPAALDGGASLGTAGHVEPADAPTKLERTPVPTHDSTRAAATLERSPAPTPLRRGRALPVVLAAALGATLAAGLGLRWLVAHAHPLDTSNAAAGASAVASTSRAAPTATVLTDLPLSPSCNAAAAEGFRAGLRALHGAAWEDASEQFDRAGEADPACPEVALRRLVLAYFFAPGGAQRERLRAATQLRDALGARDRQVFEAFAALIGREPPDRAGAIATLEKAIDRFPRDAELHVLAALVRSSAEPEKELADARRAVELDPGYVDAWQMMGEAQGLLGHTNEALAALDRCLAASPAASDCRTTRAIHLVRNGRCAEVVDEAKRWVLYDPSSAPAYGYWTLGLVATSAPAETVEEALRQRWAKLPSTARAAAEREDHARLAVLAGDFTRASSLASELETMARSDASLETHLVPVLLQVELALETRRDADAARIADLFLKRKPLWSKGAQRAFAVAGGRFFEPRLLDVRRRATPAVAGWPADRDAWIQAAQHQGALWDEGTAWAFGRAMTAKDRAEAEAALAAAPAMALAPGAELRSRVPIEVADVFTGEALLLAGRPADALRFLRVATASCHAFDQPFEHTRAHLWLGRALEASGDTAGACAAYGVVVDRWGKAQPRSVSADEARERRRVLKCPPLPPRT